MRIAYLSSAGDLCLVEAAPKETLERVLGQMTEAQYRAHVMERSIPPGAKDVRVLPSDWTPPEDRTFRSAWRMDAKGAVAVDMLRARDEWRNRLRRARREQMERLDVEYQKADEAGDASAKKAIAAQKQALRDAPQHPDIESATTPEELKAVWPL